METIYIHLLIGVLVIVGLFTYWGKATGWYKEGGLMYELWQKLKNKDNTDDTDDIDQNK